MNLEKLIAATLFTGTVFSAGYVASNYDGFTNKTNNKAAIEPVIATPYNFKAINVEHNWATLQWNHDQQDNLVKHFNIYRNGTLISRVNGRQSTFTDLHLKGENSYLYSIAAVSENQLSAKKNLTLTTTKNLAPLFRKKAHLIKIGNRNFGGFVHTLEATDPNSDRLYYSIEGKDAGLFLVNEKTGKIIIKKDLLPNKLYKIIGYASDGYNRNQITINIRS